MGAWREEHDRGRLTPKRCPASVDGSPGKYLTVSGRQGNRPATCGGWGPPPSWKTSDEAVVCGGSFDNPYRAVQASAKGTYHRRGPSSVIGFRCAQEMS